MSSFMIALVTAAAWILRGPLHAILVQRNGVLPALSSGLAVAVALAAASLLLEDWLQRRTWAKRVSAWTGWGHVTKRTNIARRMRQVGDPLECLLDHLRFIPTIAESADRWVESGMGKKPSRYFLWIGGLGLAGWWIGHRIGGPLLGAGLSLVLPFAASRYVASRAATLRARFSEQLPAALDSLAAGLAAGLSFQQAIDFASGELPDPIRGAFLRLHRKLSLGWTLEATLTDMISQRPGEDLELVVEGVRLNRRFGGDLVRMLEETSNVLREREELEREVRAVTTQGRLSGWVIAGLVPFSAGFLLLTNPGYINVLFETLVGQGLLVVVLLLQLIGWTLISRLVRIEY